MLFEHPEGYDRLLRWQDHPTLPLRIYNYTAETQYSGAWDPITLKCRGLVVNTNSRQVVANPQPKAFNLTELPSRGLDLPKTRFDVQDKLDGQLIIVFHYGGQWHAASRGSFTSVYAQKAQELLTELNTTVLRPDYTYLFELVGFERIVLKYPKPELVLFGVRATKSVWDATPRYVDAVAQALNCNSPTIFKVHTLDDLPTRENAEGFIVRFDQNFKEPFRVKIKYPEYVRLHKLMTGISTRTIWEHARRGDDILTAIEDTPDEYYSWVETTWRDLHTAFKALWYRTHEEYTRLLVRNDRKATALAFQQHATVPTGALFALLDRKNFEDILWRHLEPEYEAPFSFNQISQAQQAA